METEDFEKLKEQILFEAFSIFFAKENSRWTERSEAKRFARWKKENKEVIQSLPWEAIIRIYADPPGIAFLAGRERQNLVFGIVKTIRDAKNGP